MPPKASKSKEAPAERPILGRFSSHLKIGIVCSYFHHFFYHLIIWIIVDSQHALIKNKISLSSSFIPHILKKKKKRATQFCFSFDCLYSRLYSWFSNPGCEFLFWFCCSVTWLRFCFIVFSSSALKTYGWTWFLIHCSLFSESLELLLSAVIHLYTFVIGLCLGFSGWIAKCWQIYSFQHTYKAVNTCWKFPFLYYWT